MTYLDTSALLKRFVAEPGTVVVNTLVSRQGPVATAKIAYAETHAAFARRHRVGNLSGPQYALTCRRFENEWETWVRVDLDDDVLALARDMVRRHPLRGFDAIHLASALALRTSVGEDLSFAAADGRLLNAARAERLRALNVERPAH